jgi:hypothetical protein
MSPIVRKFKSFASKVKFLIVESDETGFKPFQEFFLMLMKFSGFHVFLASKNRVFMLLVFSLPILAALSSLRIVWCYSGNTEEVFMCVNTAMIVIQAVVKMVKFFRSRERILKMMESINKNAQEPEIENENREILLNGFKKTRFFTLLTTISIHFAYFSIVGYPILLWLVMGQHKLTMNLELPFTDHTEFNGWIINYIFGFICIHNGVYISIG